MTIRAAVVSMLRALVLAMSASVVKPAWPRYYILGTQKGATTSLAWVLHYRANIHRCNTHTDESRYFHQIMGGERYAGSHFDPVGYQALFEEPAYDADPDQLLNQGMPAVLFNAMPLSLHARVRFIAVLREPASRLLSWYNHKVGESLSSKWCRMCATCEVSDRPSIDLDHPIAPILHNFGTRKYPEIINGKPSPSFHSEGLCIIREHIHGWEFTRGFYNEQLQQWSKIWPRNQIMVFEFAKLPTAGG